MTLSFTHERPTRVRSRSLCPAPLPSAPLEHVRCAMHTGRWAHARCQCPHRASGVCLGSQVCARAQTSTWPARGPLGRWQLRQRHGRGREGGPGSAGGSALRGHPARLRAELHVRPAPLSSSPLLSLTPPGCCHCTAWPHLGADGSKLAVGATGPRALATPSRCSRLGPTGQACGPVSWGRACCPCHPGTCSGAAPALLAWTWGSLGGAVLAGVP